MIRTLRPLFRQYPAVSRAQCFSTFPAKFSAAPNTPSPAYEVFDKRTKRIQKDRAASNASVSREVSYLREEVASRMIERLAFISREFPRVLDLGAGAGTLENVLCREDTPDSELVQSRLKHVTMLESSEKLLYRDSDLNQFSFNTKMNLSRVVGDEEFLTGPDGAPLFPPESFDAVLSSMSLHWINDLPGILSRVQDVLVPDGMFMAAMLGGDSLYELRTTLQLAESERAGGVSPRMSPLADVRDMGSLMQRAKFNLLTVDVDDIIVSYPDTYSLIEDLQAMGESNAVLARQSYIPRDILVAADPIYRALHGNEDGSIPATFRVIYLIGWKPAPTQQKPLARGSAQMSLKDALPTYGSSSSSDSEKK
ncbi:uncharacterized protein SAPINGB_P006125 [Magnusiomyces paraingens]|uniref:Methyltransferase type 11 domain-containing protein n=1 Tax=Magnusiomyces paraingens TaxID=2606893 RepID=A0A5E8CAJ0_9ASCO|nr:uncharacterized protein SAPINGB_P006125 [Saprochaete ingens]VVT58276.1 unnamed protein product [Saprochaete ingens]